MTYLMGFEPTEGSALRLRRALVRQLDSGWMASATQLYSRGDPRAICFMRGGLVINFHFRPRAKLDSKATVPTAGTLYFNSPCCGDNFAKSAAFETRLWCVQCGEHTIDFAGPTLSMNVNGCGVVESYYADLVRQRMVQHAGNILDGELWMLDFQAHLSEAIDGVDFMEQQ